MNVLVRSISLCAQRTSPTTAVSAKTLLHARCYHLHTQKASMKSPNQINIQRGLASSSTGHRILSSSRNQASPSSSTRRWNAVRSLHSTAVCQHLGIDRPEPGTGIKVHFNDSKGNLIKTVEANDGDDILSIAHEYDIDLEGACEASVACSTCHVIIPEEFYDKLPEPDDDENDMLDMAFGLTDTSRLGCQVRVTRELDGLTCTLPAATRNMFVDGKKAAH